MKFTVKQITQAGRLGYVSGMEKHPGEIFETPLPVMYTRGGNVPHITYEVLQMITSENLIMQMPLTTVMSAVKGVENFGRGLSEFVGMKEYPAYVTPQDPAVQTPTGYNISNKVAIWTKNGKNSINPQQYMAMIETLKPDIYLALCDGDTDSQSSKKRITKSVTRTSKLFRECFRLHEESEVLRNTAILAPIEGGYEINARHAFAAEMAKYDVSGYVIEGLHTNGPEAEDIEFSSIEGVIAESLDCLPKEKLRIVHGAWNPVTLLQLVAAGFDMFDTSLPYVSTERGAALIFPIDDKMDVSDTRNASMEDVSELNQKSKSPSYEINLQEKMYFEDFRPLLKACCCLACKQHSRAYIHHLLTSQELLGRVLLMMHNLHHYLEFFKSIRKSIEAGTLDSLCTLVKAHCQSS